MEEESCPLVPVSWGELLDKITILEIKKERIGDPDALRNVAHELERLIDIASSVGRQPRIALLMDRLRAVNRLLWGIEENTRVKEALGDFGPEFVQLARSVYKNNDLRAALKREINLRLNSAIVEEKSYAATRSVRGKGAIDTAVR
ncbi:MAG: hypothetical protein AVDCRST_MAG23-501 [uncultured Sphingosinicella sp.]|uniref:Uncharacterized protein n=1 Tax=uncultured Sphingosinicella sp. TaxID=478748 RepID=A0A6J4TK58_9SPHN|nr:DUF6165 family protein [uncultured Sphingosinicella sp.]CAA9524649.1 MAG: hypothetical protein AVDCRST_MAG23-501 [uncultured Sphingosinicella sp.]